ncbi:MAG: hypothetical protein U9Q35_08260 [Pseudomonadota bacterium]|nr:hypothetical protein [Pseudomonadota bacterium]
MRGRYPGEHVGERLDADRRETLATDSGAERLNVHLDARERFERLSCG